MINNHTFCKNYSVFSNLNFPLIYFAFSYKHSGDRSYSFLFLRFTLTGLELRLEVNLEERIIIQIFNKLGDSQCINCVRKNLFLFVESRNLARN